MSVGLLMVTHGSIGQSLHDTAVTVIGSSPLRTRVVSVGFGHDLEKTIAQLGDTITELDTGSGVLVLTDMYGATPSNVICQLHDTNLAIVSGLNLPMLIRIMNYPTLSLNELVEKAISGGREGIMYYQTNREKHAATGN
jgi:PTS system ascorbate-specific IIA component